MENKYYSVAITGGNILGAKIYVYDSSARKKAEKALSRLVSFDFRLKLDKQEITEEQFKRFKESKVVKIIN